MTALLCGSIAAHAQKDCIKKLPFPDPLDLFPIETDTITPVKTFRGNIDRSGHKPGDQVLNFLLWTSNGEMVNLIDQSKPKLLIAGSYTCPIFRAKARAIDSLRQRYNNEVDVYIVYVVEAHPNTDQCPYRDSIWITDENKAEGILYPQPITYLDRELLAREMRQRMGIETPILIDNSNNDYWMHFGPAPNNAYLLDKHGYVIERQTWFNEGIAQSIDSLLAASNSQ